MARTLQNRRSVLRLYGAVLATAGTVGCTGWRSSDGRTVEMTDEFGFDPQRAMVEVGETVTWTNPSDVTHTVTAAEDEMPDEASYFASGGFDSERAARNAVNQGLVAPGEQYEHTFERSGTYGYYCVPHEGSGMVGTIDVE